MGGARQEPPEKCCGLRLHVNSSAELVVDLRKSSGGFAQCRNVTRGMMGEEDGAVQHLVLLGREKPLVGRPQGPRVVAAFAAAVGEFIRDVHDR
ncbi:hypothetical protein VR41_12445 [Streptomyces sp. NRRL B-1568]|nr:hypothetical protein VR41_12445 [Streptomyces sp. NRRL B-1568]